MKNKIPAVMAALLMILAAGCSGGTGYSVTETYSVSAAPDKETVLMVTLPATCGYQTIGDVEVTGAASYEIAGGEGFQTLTLYFEGGASAATVRYNAKIGTRLKESGSTEGGQSGVYLLTADEAAGLAAELKEKREMATVKKISKYVQDKAPEYAAKKIYESGIPGEALDEFFSQYSIVVQDYLSNSTRRRAYDEAMEDRIAALVINSCDYADMMCEILRAAGIPARTVHGLNLSAAMFLDGRKPVYHGWVEFYSGGAWHSADPYYGELYTDRFFGSLLSYDAADFEAFSSSKLVEDLLTGDYYIVSFTATPTNYIALSQDTGAVVTADTDYQYN